MDSHDREPEIVTLQLREEEVFAEKRLVQLGVIRIRRRVVREMRTIEVAVSREEMIVERLPFEPGGASDQDRTAADQLDPSIRERLRALQLGETLCLPIVEEEVIVQKRPIVTQELLVDKRLVEEVRKLSGAVRREDARITELVDPQPAGSDRAPAGDETTVAGTSDSDGSWRPEAPTPTFHQAERTVELREEELQLRTHVVEAGTVEVRLGVVSEQQSMVVKIAHEETDVRQIGVKGRPAERPVGSGEDILDIPEYGEQVSLRKRPVVTEELTVGRALVQDVRQVTATVRREVAHVETQGAVSLRTPEQPADQEHV